METCSSVNIFCKETMTHHDTGYSGLFEIEPLSTLEGKVCYEPHILSFFIPTPTFISESIVFHIKD